MLWLSLKQTKLYTLQLSSSSSSSSGSSSSSSSCRIIISAVAFLLCEWWGLLHWYNSMHASWEWEMLCYEYSASLLGGGIDEGSEIYFVSNEIGWLMGEGGWWERVRRYWGLVGRTRRYDVMFYRRWEDWLGDGSLKGMAVADKMTLFDGVETYWSIEIKTEYW